MLAPWDERYPSREVLRSEVESMLAAFVEALFEAIPEAEIDGIYAKGSAFREWDSPLDYVPELSDVDIHVLFKDAAAVKRHLGTLQQALSIQASVEALYFARVPVPVHVPRPQLMIANHLLTEKDYGIMHLPTPTTREFTQALRGSDAGFTNSARAGADRKVGRKWFVGESPQLVSGLPYRQMSDLPY